MRIKNVLTLIALIVASISIYGQSPITIVTPQADSLVTINTSGEIFDFDSGVKIGEIISNQIKDGSGNTLGSINGINIKDASGTTIWKANESANNKLQLTNPSDVEIGTVESNLMLFVSGVFTLNASDAIDSKWLACYYFFFYNQ